MKFSVSTAAAFGAAALLNVAGAIEPERQPHQPTGNGTKILTWNETMVNNQFGYSATSVSWIETGEDGQYIYMDSDGALVLEDFITGASEIFVAAEDIPADMYDYWIHSDLSKVMFATNYTKQYRYSYFANYMILDVESGETTALVEDQDGDIQYAEFAPVGDAIAFVRANDLYISKAGEISQITTDGSADMFNAVPDWVYEEEIFGSRSTFWWSPDAEALAYLSFNETGVETFTVQYFMDNQEVAPVYPDELDLRYPKVGTKNPTVALTVLMVESEEKLEVPMNAYEADNLVIGELAWVTPEHGSLIYRAYNRVQDHSKHVRVDITEEIATEIIRERDGSDGWLDNTVSMQYVGDIGGKEYYLDISDESGWAHIYLFPIDGSNGTAITEGEWEVYSIYHIDSAKSLIYFTSTKGDSTERHLYKVNYETKKMTAMVDEDVPAYWSASFSTGGGYYILSYNGPDVPYQELYAINDTVNPMRVVTSNEELWNTLQDYNLPNITYFTLDHPSGFEINVMQRLPPNFDPSKKYPVLFTPYGGPGAQEITKAFQSLDWTAYISSEPELQYVTFTVDNRGSGYQGRAFRSTVASHLGEFEAEDQIWVAEQLSAKYSWIDTNHIGIQGWSYGGYLSSKVVEANSGVFTTALIVAPVSDWRFYDSMYTERYMKTSQMNPEGYNTTAVRKPEGFSNIVGGVSIMHGTGDDNVHYQNAAALVDLLVGAGVPPQKLEWRAFTDSDHSIVYNGANEYLYKHMTERLYAETLRTNTTMTHQWSRRGSVEDLFERE